ncbi:MAG TPA: N-acetyl-gamma-glutamyl-phosphate reductase [Longimicrobiales bacterium]|nr:N-acetyl-gamma-glutamyl-phosphate reductase [Longimicrobiales bacterium]
MMNKPARAGIIGATGYSGLEVAALIARHPRLELAFATSEAEAGRPARGTALRYVPAAEAPLGDADVVFSCLPTGHSGAWALRALEAGAAVVDLSADLRAGESRAVYGLPELWREDLGGARLVANPGCYPTGVLLALAPALRAGLVDASRPVVIDAASGVTGAGRSAKRELLFGEVAEDYRAYAVGNRHRHVPEIRGGLARVAGGTAPSCIFTPHLLPVQRGILETIYLPLREALPVSDAVGVWTEFFAGEPCIEVLGTELPSLRDVVGRNVVAVGLSEVEGVEAPTLLVVAALDNLVKGAAGQAVQNANLVLGFPELEGLPL